MAYGGYGISMTPWFDPLLRLWLDYGGVFAVANVRGGGEYGEPWHVAGMLTRKQNVFDDFAAAMQSARGAQIHESRAARDHRPLQRRTDDGRRVDAATAGDARGRERRRHVRRVALGNAAERRVQHDGIRFGQGCRAVQGALRLFAAVARARWRRLSGRAVDDWRQRRPRGAVRVTQDGGASAGGHVLGQTRFFCARKPRLVTAWARRLPSGSRRRPTSMHFSSISSAWRSPSVKSRFAPRRRSPPPQVRRGENHG